MRTGTTWLVAAAIAAAAAGCGSSGAERCADDTFCPSDTTCSATGRCLVNANACAAFAENAPCQGVDGAAFCTAGECLPAVSITGQVLELRGEDIIDGQVTGVDRPWMDPVDIAIGAFVVPAVRNDTELILRIEAAGLMPLLTRRLTLTEVDLLINEDANEPLRMVFEDGHQLFTERIGETYDPASGLAVIRIDGNAGDGSLAGSTVVLTGGATAPTPLYFSTSAQGDPARTATSGASGLVVFPNVAPGDYVAEINPAEPRACRAAGDVAATVISLRVESGTSTNVGTVFCED